MNVDEKIRIIASQQHGVLGRAQLAGIGLSRAAIAGRLRRGELRRLSRDVFLLGGVPDTVHQRILAAVFDAGSGACASHDTAAALWGIPRFELEPVHVWRVRDRSSHADRLGIQHKTRRILPYQVLRPYGIPTTSPTRALLDQAACLQPWEVERLLEDELLMGLTNYWLVDRMLCSMSRQGRTGLTIVRELNAARGPNYRPAESNLERRVIRLLEDAGFVGFDRQVDVLDELVWIARVDLRHRIEPLVLEVQSDRYHTALIDKAADRRRIAALERMGLVVVEITEHAAWHDPQTMIDEVAAGYDHARLRRLSAA